MHKTPDRSADPNHTPDPDRDTDPFGVPDPAGEPESDNMPDPSGTPHTEPIEEPGRQPEPVENPEPNPPKKHEGEDRELHPEFDEDNRDLPLEEPIDAPKTPL